MKIVLLRTHIDAEPQIDNIAYTNVEAKPPIHRSVLLYLMIYKSVWNQNQLHIEYIKFGKKQTFWVENWAPWKEENPLGLGVE